MMNPKEIINKKALVDNGFMEIHFNRNINGGFFRYVKTLRPMWEDEFKKEQVSISVGIPGNYCDIDVFINTSNSSLICPAVKTMNQLMTLYDLLVVVEPRNL